MSISDDNRRKARDFWGFATMASSTLFKKSSFSTVKSAALGAARFAGSRTFASISVGTDLVSAAPDVSLQKARTWDEGVSSKFSTTPLKDIFKDKKVVIFGLPGAFTGVCSTQHVPSYKNNFDKFTARGIDYVICVAVNDPYVMNSRHGSATASRQMTIFYASQAHVFYEVHPNKAILQARVGRNVDGMDLNLYQQSLQLLRQFQADQHIT